MYAKDITDARDSSCWMADVVDSEYMGRWIVIFKNSKKSEKLALNSSNSEKKLYNKFSTENPV